MVRLGLVSPLVETNASIRIRFPNVSEATDSCGSCLLPANFYVESRLQDVMVSSLPVSSSHARTSCVAAALPSEPVLE